MLIYTISISRILILSFVCPPSLLFFNLLFDNTERNVILIIFFHYFLNQVF